MNTREPRRRQRAFRNTALKVLLILFVIVAGYYLYEFGYAWLGMGGFIDETTYASGYSQRQFDLIKPGWTMQQVETALGDPMRRTEWQWGRGRTLERWDYSRKGPLGGHLRRIYFEGDQVVFIVAEWEAG